MHYVLLDYSNYKHYFNAQTTYNVYKKPSSKGRGNKTNENHVYAPLTGDMSQEMGGYGETGGRRVSLLNRVEFPKTFYRPREREREGDRRKKK